ncbi:MAG: hypothetical protein D6725_10325 [Planctomycetota bacterium]|nr:MAG: hypothetical protein D6725_10325 [Planctomycetota bacterium]
MPWKTDFAADAEFRKVMAHERDVDLVRVALEIARDVDPQLDFAPVLGWIAERGEELRRVVATAWSDEEVLRELARLLGGVHGLRGELSCYEVPEGSYLPHVIRRRRGLPIALSIVYIGVGRHVGLELQGAASPGRFLIRCETVSGVRFLDPYDGGRMYDEWGATGLLQRLTGIDAELLKQTLQPATPRAIVIRMLNNLKLIYVRRGEWLKALRVQQRLTALKPAEYEERRDLGYLLLHAGHPGPALNLLTHCLRHCPADESPTLANHISRAERELASFN